MSDRIDVLQVGRFWRIFVNGGIVTRGTSQLKPREFLTDLRAWQWLAEVQRSHLERTGENLGWTIKGETQ